MISFAVCVTLFAFSVKGSEDAQVTPTPTAPPMQIKFYKISMVASVKTPGQPAIFEHGESPVWDGERKRLLFVDVTKQNIHYLDYDSGEITTKHIEYGPTQVVTTVANSKRVLISARASLYLMDWDVEGDAALRPLTSVDLGLPDNIINEGKADIKGRFWMGTKGPQTGDDVLPDYATFYSMSQLELENPKIQLKPVSISNGLVWAPNNSVMYYTDSATQRVDAFDFDAEKGTISGRRTIIDVTAYGYEDAIPDGMTIDTNGNLWVALMFGGTVLHIDPDERRVIFGYKLPVSRTTSVVWGGPNLDELFVTTSRKDVDIAVETLAGAIFTIRGTGSVGLPHFPFIIDNPDTY